MQGRDTQEGAERNTQEVQKGALGSSIQRGTVRNAEGSTAGGACRGEHQGWRSTQG